MQDSGEVCGGSDRWAIILSEPLFVCSGNGQADRWESLQSMMFADDFMTVGSRWRYAQERRGIKVRGRTE